MAVVGSATKKPAYGSNISNFDPTNDKHKQIADLGMQWQAASGNKQLQGQLNQQANAIRNSIGNGGSYDSIKGVHTMGMEKQQPMPPSPISYGGGGGGGGGGSSWSPPETPTISFDDASKQVSGQLDPLFARALQNLKNNQYQNEMNAGERASKIGGSHSGLQQDQLNKIALASQGQAADMEASKQAKIAEMAQALVNRDQDRADRIREQLFSEYMGQQNLGLQQGQLTGNYNNQRTLAGQQQDWGQNMDWADRTGYMRNGIQTLAGKQFNAQQDQRQQDNQFREKQFTTQEAQRQWDNTFKTQQFDFTKAQQLWENTFKDKSFDQSVKQFSQQMGLDWSKLNQQQSQFVSEMAFKNKAQQLDQNKFDWSKDPSNPSYYGSSSKPKETQIPSKDSYENLSATKNEMSKSSNVTNQEAKSYANSVRDQFSDSDYRDLMKWIDEKFIN